MLQKQIKKIFEDHEKRIKKLESKFEQFIELSMDKKDIEKEEFRRKENIIKGAEDKIEEIKPKNENEIKQNSKRLEPKPRKAILTRPKEK